jgi:hypothetical protein
VAFEALVVPHEFRARHVHLFERVKNPAELRISHRKLEQRRAGHVADVGVVVEIQGARMRRRNAFALKRSLREDEHLRGFRNAEDIEDRRQVSELRIEFQRDLAAVDFFLKRGNRAASLGFAVADGVLIERHEMRGALKIVGACGERDGDKRRSQRECGGKSPRPIAAACGPRDAANRFQLHRQLRRAVPR